MPILGLALIFAAWRLSEYERKDRERSDWMVDYLEILKSEE